MGTSSFLLQKQLQIRNDLLSKQWDKVVTTNSPLDKIFFLCTRAQPFPTYLCVCFLSKLLYNGNFVSAVTIPYCVVVW